MPAVEMAVFSSKSYDKKFLGEANSGRHRLLFLDAHLDTDSATLAEGFEAVCVFVNDCVSREVLSRLQAGGTRLVLLRSAGFNHVDLRAAAEFGITIARVPSYSPHAVAEHTLALLLALNRKTHRAYSRVREGNFALDGLLGFDLYGKTIGIVGLGKIGLCFARIARGLGMRVLGTDPAFTDEARDIVEERTFGELLAESDIVSLHCPLNPKTHHLIDEHSLSLVRHGTILLNTSRGGLVNSRSVIRSLKSGQLGGLGIDVYEEEADLFFENLSDRVIQDDVFTRLLTFPNVLITGHQGFFTIEALRNIAQTTIDNLTSFQAGIPINTVSMEFVG